MMHCISSVSFSFKVKGKVLGNVVPTRGLRQGYLISPYLFILCADVFSTLISKALHRNALHGVSICSAPLYLICFFADDSILFAKATVSECSMVANIISLCEGASG